MNIGMDSIGLASDVLGTGVGIGSIANALPTHRQCSVHITNECSNYTLCNPSVYTESGRCFIPFPPTLRPSAAGEALFSKVATTARGAVGVFTYDLLDNTSKVSTEKIAVMYKVPFDQNTKANAYALGVYGVSKECNKHLFREMSKDTNASFVRGLAKGPSLTHKSDTVTVNATMSDCHQPFMKVQVSDN